MPGKMEEDVGNFLPGVQLELSTNGIFSTAQLTELCIGLML